MTRSRSPCPDRGRPARAQGFVLIVALIFLITLTILGLAASGTTSVEVRMANSFNDREIAFSAAEAAIRDAELHINGYWTNPVTPVSPYGFNASCSNGLCDNTVTQPLSDNDFFGGTAPGSNSVALGTITGTPAIANLSAQPRYLIEAICRIKPGSVAECQNIYRITAQATGRNAVTRVTLQTTYVP